MYPCTFMLVSVYYVIFGLTAIVDSAGSVDNIDIRNSFNPVVMILFLFDISDSRLKGYSR